MVIVLLSALTLVRADEEGVHRFANFNIRFANATADTGDKQWANRREYVLQITQDYDFDIVGMEEVTGNNKDAVTGKSQLQDMYDGMTGYDHWQVERNGNGSNSEYEVIFYKTAKYTLLDKGLFYLNEHPETPGEGWAVDAGTNYRRALCWVHLRDNSSLADFYFAVTHTNYGPYESGIESAQLIGSRLRRIAGTRPVVLVGDFNMRRDEHELAYRGYAASFYDAALHTTTTCLPKGNVSFTATNWYPVTNSACTGSEFDYIFYDGMEPLSRHIITEDYNRSVTPSDHFPVLVRFRFAAPHPTRYYATDEPSLLSALAQITIGDTLCLAAGEIALTAPITPSCSFCMMGGWDEAFSSVVGTTTLTAPENNPVLAIPHWYAMEMHNMVLCGGSVSSLTGGGAVCSHGLSLDMNHCILRNNTSSSLGGALAVTTDRLALSACLFENNTALSGGALYADVRKHISLTDCLFRSNKAQSGSAVYVAGASSATMLYSSFSSNESERYGTLCFAQNSRLQSASVVNCCFLNNVLNASKGLAAVTKLYGGAAVYARLNGTDQYLNIGHCSILGNETRFNGNASNFAGAAVNVFSASARLMNNLVLANPLRLTNDGSSSWSDLYTADDAALTVNSHNLYSSSAEISGWESDRAATFGNSDSIRVLDDGSYVFLAKQIAAYKLSVLLSSERQCETVFQCDLDGDGKISGAVTRDYLHRQRGIQACIGALDAVVEAPQEEAVHETLIPNAATTVYSLTGMPMGEDLSRLPAGVYIQGGKKIVIR